MEERASRYLYRKTVKGNRYNYFRRPDGKLIRLPDDEWSAEFRGAYAACIKALAPKKPPEPLSPAP